MIITVYSVCFGVANSQKNPFSALEGTEKGEES